MAYDLNQNPQVRQTLLQAGRFLQYNCIEPVAGRKDMLAVWSHPQLNRSDNPLQAKLGGTGLTLVALVAMERTHPGSATLDEFRGLGRFIEFMQKDDGSFYSKYIPGKGGRDDEWTSLYYPGEAALGMVVLYERDPLPQWRNSAIAALEYLARSRQSQKKVPADHWALLATARLLELQDHGLSTRQRERLVQHAIQICESMLDEQVIGSNVPSLIGSFTPDGRTTPTATRLEGLCAALTFLPLEKNALRTRMTHSVQLGMNFLINTQVRSGEYRGAFPRALAKLPADDSRRIRNFNRRATEVRIDYVQHAMSAMIQYLELFAPTQTAMASQAD